MLFPLWGVVPDLSERSGALSVLPSAGAGYRMCAQTACGSGTVSAHTGRCPLS